MEIIDDTELDGEELAPLEDEAISDEEELFDDFEDSELDIEEDILDEEE